MTAPTRRPAGHRRFVAGVAVTHAPLLVLALALAQAWSLGVAQGVAAPVQTLPGLTSTAPPTPPLPVTPPVAAPIARGPAPLPSEPWDSHPRPNREAMADPTARPTPLPDRVATRVVIVTLAIDLPVIGQPTAYPPCGVAMYFAALRQPGQGGATYLYAHARTGLFLPLLTASKVGAGQSLIGLTVRVYVSDDLVFFYRIARVLPHQTGLDQVYATPGERLWLQTSEGPNATYPKLQVMADPIGSGPVEHAAAHPTARPVACG